MRKLDLGPPPLEWGGYIIRPTDQKHEEIHLAPSAPGLYAWYARNGYLMYVGRSTSIRDRLRQHERGTIFMGGRPSYFSFKVIPEPLVAGIEAAHIASLGPPENTARGSGSVPFWDELVSAIENAWRDDLPVQRAWLDVRYTELAEQIAARL